jgi:hypothetical protein
MNMMRWKIEVILVLLILFLPMIATAEETTKVYSVEELEAYEQDGWKISTGMSYTMPEIISERAKVGENVLIEGSVHVNMRKEIKEETMRLYGRVSNYQIEVFVYRNDLLIFEGYPMITDDRGFYKYTKFIPREPGYYKIVFYDYRWKEWHPLSPNTTFAFYVYEKDTDNDGVPDKYDYDPYDPNIQSRGDAKAPAFEAIFAIAGLLAVAYLLRRRR